MLHLSSSGDDFYPKKPDFDQTSHDTKEFEQITTAEFRAMTTNVHRSEHHSLHNMQIVQSPQTRDSHIDASTHEFKAKL